nr:putative receptor-like protein kinase At4g00960 [Ipomoea batatas]
MKKRMAKCYAKKTKEETSTTDEDINVVDFLEYDFITIQNSTNNFSNANKIGECDYSVIYKAYITPNCPKRVHDFLCYMIINVSSVFALAWTHWKGGSPSNVIDPIMLRGISTPVHEITKCIHIALLCVQESVPDRPKMIEVLQMLNNLSISLPEPLDPGLFIGGSISSEASSQFTKNVKSISDQYDRKMQKKKAKSYAKSKFHEDFNLQPNE